MYVLREAFAYGYREIAAVLDLTEANCRHPHRRAAGRVAVPEARFEPAPQRRAGLVESFLPAAQHGDMAGPEKILAEDVTWWSDGGGDGVSAARRPVEGREKVLRLVAGGRERFAGGLDFSVTEVNGSPRWSPGPGTRSWAPRPSPSGAVS
ncbi:hypothetical protein ACSCB1_29545 [Streptomyces europaeiscabiei]|uniref:Transposase n=1 Tax=Streptomyces europaeiscabiei TaxID=146819 RepID=A0ABU4NSC7_9ACTN|nr:hypothetical protein [Streptomyces europaeiscabiei]MDX2525422.1 hypothetical protein [Streptomyces europaeiscabiei]MDX2764138.1 hypothetical protein [Streptomyces europaeiscabiei]MDX2773768.1 hypothetical protein [Streptomyces europaeiscabiei]MDX3547019.1 hypothetical protein [Streptomyces europaeiscabiei]MDX3556712.1 hypothetical protein [Streptomyces europaeiscabiei]